MARYHNYFHNPKNKGSEPVINTEAEPVEYKDFFIYQRFKGCFDIVHKDVCVGVFAGLDGAKTAIEDNERIYIKRAYNFLKDKRK